MKYIVIQVILSEFLLWTSGMLNHCNAEDYIFPEGYQVMVNRSFSDTIVSAEDPVFVNFQLINCLSDTLKGFYYTEHVPSNFDITDVSVTIDQTEIFDFLSETTSAGDIYLNAITYRWIIDLPGDLPSSGIPPDSSELVINYLLSCDIPGFYTFNHYSWIGIADSNATFGYCDSVAITVCDEDTLDFIRGDADNNTEINSADAVYILRYKFIPGSSEIACMDAGDSDDDGSVGMVDAIYILKYRFMPGNPPPPSPFPDCGRDPTPDPLGCSSFPCLNP